MCNVWCKYYFRSAALDEIYGKDKDVSLIVHDANVMYSVWTCEER